MDSMDNSKVVSPAPPIGSRATNPFVLEGQCSYIATRPGTSPLEGQVLPRYMGIMWRLLTDRGHFSSTTQYTT